MIPTSIYKYFGPERIDVLKYGQIAYTPPSRFNDPFDMNPAVDIDVSDEILDMYCDLFGKDLSQENQTSTMLGNIRIEYKSVMRNDKIRINREMNADFTNLNSVGVFCCTEHKNDMLMWSHYADHHEGFVVEFDLTHPFFEERMFSVIYHDNRPRLTSPTKSDIETINLVCTKSSKWESEKEWRSIEQLANCLPKHSIGKDGDPITIYLHPYPKEAVKRIISGCRMSTQNKETLRTQIFSWGFTECILEELSLHPQHYEFERRIIELSTEGL